jgi:signal transduction histidine kinase
MRNSRRLNWLIFAVCALLVVDGLGWVTWQVLALERREHEAQRRAERQETVRLALWRMDGLLSPIIAAEAARPYFHYRSFYPAERAYSRMWEPLQPGEVLVPSPLLSGPGDYIKLHFEGTHDGWLTSPQVPDEALRDRGYDVAPAADRALLELTSLLRGAPEHPGLDGAPAPAEAAAGKDRSVQLEQLSKAERDQSSLLGAELQSLEAGEARQDLDAERSVSEYQARRQTAEYARNTQQIAGQRAQDAAVPLPGGDDAAAASIPESLTRAEGASAANVQTSPFRPVWFRSHSTDEPELLFIRSVRVSDTETLQGVWMDWPSLRAALLATSSEILPHASLEPLVTDAATPASPASLGSVADAGRLLAGVPAILLPGSLDIDAIRGLTPTRTVLLIAWLAVVAAVVAIALVLRASLALSERRGRFVSAVTHELRTPLTTFCLYSQMLADGMVRDEARRGEYLGTLKRESERLAGIVENVLAYARMGAGLRRAGAPVQPVAELLDTITPSLRERAHQCGMTLELDADAPGLHVAADRGSLERVIANLVDNACKYAADAADPRITLRVRPRAGGVEFRVRDRGPGVPKHERRRIFSPFVRARRDAADASSGLGLGLALARGVARSLGGDLRLVRSVEPGAEFVLWVPGANPTPVPG